MCTHTSLCYLLWRLCSMNPGQKGSPLLAFYAVALLMVFLMAADGRREPLAPGLGVQHSFNKSKSVLCHYINIFGQLPWRSGGAASYRSLRYVGTGETSGAAKPPQKTRKQKQRTRWTQEKKSQAHLNICWRSYIEAVVSVIIYRRHTLLPLSTNQRGSRHTQWKLPPFSSCENEIQGHKDNMRLSLRPLLPFV